MSNVNHCSSCTCRTMNVKLMMLSLDEFPQNWTVRMQSILGATIIFYYRKCHLSRHRARINSAEIWRKSDPVFHSMTRNVFHNIDDEVISFAVPHTKIRILTHDTSPMHTTAAVRSRRCRRRKRQTSTNTCAHSRTLSLVPIVLKIQWILHSAAAFVCGYSEYAVAAAAAARRPQVYACVCGFNETAETRSKGGKKRFAAIHHRQSNKYAVVYEIRCGSGWRLSETKNIPTKRIETFLSTWFRFAPAWAWPVPVCVCSLSPRAPRRGPAFLCAAFCRPHANGEPVFGLTSPCMCLVFTHIFISHHFSFVRRPLLRSFCNNSRFFRRSVLFRFFASIHTHAFYHSRK